MNLLPERESAIPDGQRGTSLRYHGVRIAIALLVAAITYALFPAAPAVDFPVLEVGSVAPDNVIAPFGFQVRKTDAELAAERAEIMRSVQPILSFAPAGLDSTRRALAGLGDVIRRSLNQPGGAPDHAAIIQRGAERLGLRLTAPEALYIAQSARGAAVTEAVGRVFDRWLTVGIAPAGALDAVQGLVTLRRDGIERSVPADSILTFTSLLSRARLMHPDPGSAVGDAVFRKLLAAFFHPTITYDRVATELARQELRRSVPVAKYELRAGEKIVGAHEVVGREEYEKLRALRDALEQRSAGSRNASRITGAVLFNLLVVAIFGLTLNFFRPQIYRSIRSLILIAVVFVVVLASAALVAQATDPPIPELIPVAFAAIIISVLFDAQIGMVAAMTLAVLIGGQGDFRGTNALFLNLIGGTVAAFTVRGARRRNQTYYSILVIAGAYLLAAVAIGLTLDRPAGEIVVSAAWGTLNAVVSVSVAMVLLPAAEEFTRIDTYFKLLEWSDLNRPLLRRLSLEAPGTYAHTIAIANLAETACNAIGANGLLARVGAYYHDIGKLKKPQYFVENQAKGRNPHDKLKPGTSATIIRNHVREGLELAQEYKLPRAVYAFITEHHGTGPISYFLEKARERDGNQSSTAEFAYPGPVPQSAETAVCMLADGIEAAVRVLHEPTAERIRDVIDRIVRQRMEQGQLREAPLTLQQLETVKEQFARVLIGMYHNRIDYPVSAGGITSETTVAL